MGNCANFFNKKVAIIGGIWLGIIFFLGETQPETGQFLLIFGNVKISNIGYFDIKCSAERPIRGFFICK